MLFRSRGALGERWCVGRGQTRAKRFGGSSQQAKERRERAAWIQCDHPTSHSMTLARGVGQVQGSSSKEMRVLWDGEFWGERGGEPQSWTGYSRGQTHHTTPSPVGLKLGSDIHTPARTPHRTAPPLGNTDHDNGTRGVGYAGARKWPARHLANLSRKSKPNRQNQSVGTWRRTRLSSQGDMLEPQPGRLIGSRNKTQSVVIIGDLSLLHYLFIIITPTLFPGKAVRSWG